MDTTLAAPFASQKKAQKAADIIRNCVHCGFCTATCPTYQLLGDESDSPRGRIYLVRQLLETGSANDKTRLHLDRCLLCRSCETTCPSGVQYGQLLETGRELVEQVNPRPSINTLRRKWLSRGLVQTSLLTHAAKTGVRLRNWLPAGISKQLPEQWPDETWPAARHSRKMLVLEGCVQPALAPNTNLASARVLDTLGISLLREAPGGCCGAVGLHTSNQEMGREHARQRIDSWWPQIEQGIEAIIFTASGCGVTIRDYGEMFRDDPTYSQKAARISELAQDISEVVLAEINQLDANRGKGRKVAFHPPCTLQHGLKLGGVVEQILRASGYELVPVSDSHLCCGSAGTYSLFQPELSEKLKQNKLQALQQQSPELIATANIGCQQHLKTGTERKVVHWIELL